MMTIDMIAWIVLRIVYAWMFLYPLKSLFTDFDGAVNLVSLITSYKPLYFTYLMIAVMIIGALMILFGIYAEIAGIMLFIYNLLGVFVHYKLAKQASQAKLSARATRHNQRVFQKVAKLAAMGNVTSAQKNIVLAAVALFFILLGSGPLSLTGNIF